MIAFDSPLPVGWSVLRSEYLYRRPWLTVRRDALQLPNGHTIPEYYVLEYPAWVNVLAVTERGQLVLIRQFRYGLRDTHFELCAGVVDPTDASPLDAAKRELLEETGYGGGQWVEWMKTAPNPATSNNYAYSFLATNVTLLQAPKPEASEDISVHVCDLNEVLEMMERGAIVQATHLAPLWRYVAEQKAAS